MFRLAILIRAGNSFERFAGAGSKDVCKILRRGKMLTKEVNVAMYVLKNKRIIASIRNGMIIAVEDKDAMAEGIMKAKRCSSELLLEVMGFYL